MADDPLIGRTLHSNYRIESLLGCGGMACVYYAWDKNLDRAAAIKVIDTVQQTNPAYARRIVQEAKSIAKWRHENIVQVYHAATEDGLYYFAMEYIAGRDLGDLLKYYGDRAELIPHDDLLRIGWAVARALDYAHQHGVIHRDIKPANVMIAADGRIVLTDFGLALDVAQGTRGEVFGSPHYIAPEQAVSSGAAVPQSDLYALGIILYEMLTGRLPFNDPSPVSLAVQHINQPLPLPSTLNPDISISTEAVLLKALSKEPQDRFASGEALMKALEHSLLDQQHPVSHVSTPQRGISRTTLAEFVKQNPAPSPSRDAYPTKPTPPLMKITVPPRPPTQADAPIKVKVPTRSFSWELVIGSAMLLAVILTAAWVLKQNNAIPTIGAIPTLMPTETAEPTLTPTPTEVPMMDYSVILYYNDSGFFLWNHGDRAVSVTPLHFEAINEDGIPAPYAFSGDSWARLYPTVESGHCDALYIENSRISERPSNCQQYSASRTRSAASSLVFWLPREGVTHFRVTWEGAEIAMCEIAVAQCEIVVQVPVEE